MKGVRHVDTLVNHPRRVHLEAGNTPVIEPIYQSVKFTFPSLEAMKARSPEAFIYSRVSNPTVRQLELLLADCQGVEDGLAVGSGIAALSTLFFALLKKDDHVILFSDSYKPTRYLVRDLLGKFGVTHSIHSLRGLDGLEQSIGKRPAQMIVFEAPTNPMTRIPDMDRILAIAKRSKAVTVLDSTFAGLTELKGLGVDYYVHSLTKFASGHGDVMGGVILSSKAGIDRVKETVVEIGPTLDPHAAYLILRGMKTYGLRVERQAQNALTIAKWLEEQVQVDRVFYPGLPSHPDFKHAQKNLQSGGAILALNLKGGARACEDLISNLKLFHLAGSVGSTESLVAPISLFFAGDLTTEQKIDCSITEGSVRLSIGTEHIEDLKSDLAHALLKVSTVR